MPVLADLLDALRTGRVEVVDLTAPLHSGTPIIQLPPPFANAAPFALTERQPLRRARPRLVLERHLHQRAHRHPLRRTGALDHRAGRRGRVAGPGLQARRARGGARLLRRGREGPRLPAGGRARPRLGGRARAAARGRLAALPHRMGRAQRGLRRLPRTPNETGPHTPGISVACARWLAAEAPVIGIGVETVGTDAGAAHSFDPAVPVPLLRARRRQVRAHPAAEPGPAPRHGCGRARRAAADRVGVRQPGAGAGAGRAADCLIGRERGDGWLTRLGGDGVRPARPAPSPFRRRRARPAGSRARVRRRRQRQLPRHQRAARRRSAVRRGPARGRRRDDGRRLGAHRPGAPRSSPSTRAAGSPTP